MLSHIQPGGVYLCEDLHGAVNDFSAFVSGLAWKLNDASHRTEDVFDSPIIPSDFQVAVKSITSYPFVTVIEKHNAHTGKLIVQKARD